MIFINHTYISKSITYHCVHLLDISRKWLNSCHGDALTLTGSTGSHDSTSPSTATAPFLKTELIIALSENKENISPHPFSG